MRFTEKMAVRKAMSKSKRGKHLVGSSAVAAILLEDVALLWSRIIDYVQGVEK